MSVLCYSETTALAVRSSDGRTACLFACVTSLDWKETEGETVSTWSPRARTTHAHILGASGQDVLVARLHGCLKDRRVAVGAVAVVDACAADCPLRLLRGAAVAEFLGGVRIAFLIAQEM